MATPYHLLSNDEKKRILLRKMKNKSQFPYFRFTEKCTDINDALKWYNHFVNKEIPCCIVLSVDENTKIEKESKRKKPENMIESYSVWVWGIEYVSVNQSGAFDKEPNKENIEHFGYIVVSTKSFRKNLADFNDDKYTNVEKKDNKGA